MFRAYFDECGHQTPDWVTVAGFVGHEDQWRQFVPIWKKALGQRRFLHMSELRWGQPRTETLLQRLGPIPYQCQLEPAHGTVRVSDYADLITGGPEERLYHGYATCVDWVVGQILRGIPSDQRLEVIFEQQVQYEYSADLMLHALQEIPWSEYQTNEGRPKLAKWGFTPKGSTVRTDPADYLASALWRIHEDRRSVKSRLCLPILGPDGLSGRAYGGTITRTQVRRMVARAQLMNRAQGL